MNNDEGKRLNDMETMPLKNQTIQEMGYTYVFVLGIFSIKVSTHSST